MSLVIIAGPLSCGERRGHIAICILTYGRYAEREIDRYLVVELDRLLSAFVYLSKRTLTFIFGRRCCDGCGKRAPMHRIIGLPKAKRVIEQQFTSLSEIWNERTKQSVYKVEQTKDNGTIRHCNICKSRA